MATVLSHHSEQHGGLDRNYNAFKVVLRGIHYACRTFG